MLHALATMTSDERNHTMKKQKMKNTIGNRHNSAIHFMNDFNHNNKKNIRGNLCHKNTNKEKKLKYNFQFYSQFLNLIFFAPLVYSLFASIRPLTIDPLIQTLECAFQLLFVIKLKVLCP